MSENRRSHTFEICLPAKYTIGDVEPNMNNNNVIIHLYEPGCKPSLSFTKTIYIFTFEIPNDYLFRANVSGNNQENLQKWQTHNIKSFPRILYLILQFLQHLLHALKSTENLTATPSYCTAHCIASLTLWLLDTP